MNNIDAYAQDRATRALTSEREIKSLKTGSVKTANAIGKTLKDSGIHHLYSTDEIETLRKAQQLIDRHARALTKAAQLKAKTVKERAAKRELENKQKEAEIHKRLFADRSDDETVIVIKALADFIRIYPLRYFRYYPQDIGAMIESGRIELDELKSRIANALFLIGSDSWIGTEQFDFEAFEALCDQRLAQARFNPEINDRSEAALAL